MAERFRKDAPAGSALGGDLFSGFSSPPLLGRLATSSRALFLEALSSDRSAWHFSSASLSLLLAASSCFDFCSRSTAACFDAEAAIDVPSVHCEAASAGGSSSLCSASAIAWIFWLARILAERAFSKAGLADFRPDFLPYHVGVCNISAP